MNKNVTFEERDEFKRKKIANNLLKLINSEDVDISPVVLDGPWGSGKTEFCYKLINLIESEGGATCVYVDAYRYDQGDDPLLTLISSISSKLPEGENKESFLNKSLPVVKVLGKVGLKAAISWGLRTSAEEVQADLSEAIKDEADSVVDESLRKVLSSFEQIDENISLLKHALQKVAGNKKIIVVIDELDRCRPSYALSMLEKVKHIFDVQNVDFVFSTNLAQLNAVVKKQYGSEINANLYLTKFFNFKVKLPSDYLVSTSTFRDNGFSHFKNLLKSDSDFELFLNSDNTPSWLMENLFKKNRHSLRDAEKLFHNLKIFNVLTPSHGIKSDTQWAYSVLMALSVYIYTFEHELVEKIIHRKVRCADFISFFGVSKTGLEATEWDVPDKVFLAFFLLDFKWNETKEFIPEELKEDWDSVSSKMFLGARGIGLAKGKRIDYLRENIRSMQLMV